LVLQEDCELFDAWIDFDGWGLWGAWGGFLVCAEWIEKSGSNAHPLTITPREIGFSGGDRDASFS
jgi:hypothetical protein